MTKAGYRTLMGEGSSFLEDRKSRFLGRARHVDTEEEAYAFIDSIRKAEKGAAHNVYAFSIGRSKEVVRSSDDGEPSGTSGKPCLEALMMKDLTDSIVVVTRYFGGTLLGTGGLVRAYGAVAREAVAAAGVGGLKLMRKLALKLGYPEWSRAEGQLKVIGAEEWSAKYAEYVQVTVMLPEVSAESFMDKLRDLSLGRYGVISEETEEKLVRID